MSNGISMSKRGRFHHGNLREALLEEAREVLAQSGYDAISLRDLAAKAGVAPSAPYRHFKNREALLHTLMLEGNEELRVAYDDAAREGSSPHDRLCRACQAYIDFAVRRPNLFQLIFESGTEIDLRADQAEGIKALSGFLTFRKLVAETAPDATDEQILMATIACWSTIHGYASLKLRRRLDRFMNSDFSEAAFVANAARLPAQICAEQDSKAATQPA